MKIALLSDIHDHIWNLDAALASIDEAGVLLCCGDLCSPFIMARLADGFPGEIHVVFGNNDADLYRITAVAARHEGRVHLHGEMADVGLGGKRIAVQHYNNIARAVAASGHYDVVCFGHNHRREVSWLKAGGREVLLLNPGPLMGVTFAQGKAAPTEATFMIYDTVSEEVTTYAVQPPDAGGVTRVVVPV